ncbi:Tubulin--tyrosine ligase-like protein 12 [Strongyloides ratti]|uniref:Tubulin--tyrosine ligase-like protein 12 n=1 Tax=Strongyloides ratti TaxID=34506 RepID=A0A090KYC7_STRRB|nr:Tubulin--tyrosine ligase-like protein 12 [Strongyloides ratti]CEF62530.1 Tubulin--tyrosine ligase-like protein 12 [Strongyloides ratti]
MSVVKAVEPPQPHPLDMNMDDMFEMMKTQLHQSGVPEILHAAIFRKVNQEIFDAGDFFEVTMMVDDNEEPIKKQTFATKDIGCNDTESVWLIDHAWTFLPNTAIESLKKIPQLLGRLMTMFLLHSQDKENGTERLVKTVYKELFKYAQTYSITDPSKPMGDNTINYWYVVDEFGVSIGHSDMPNCRMVPFFVPTKGYTLSILFLTEDIKKGQELTRDFVDVGLAKKHPKWRDILLTVWDEDRHIDEKLFEKNEITDEYFTLGRIPDHIPSDEVQAKCKPFIYNKDKPIRLYDNDQQLFSNLKDIKVEFVDNIYEADVIWLRHHFSEFKDLAEKNSTALVNQFPYESSLTVKDLFAANVELVFNDTEFDSVKMVKPPLWLPITYNLNTELPQFYKYFKEREKKNLNNTFIIKPWNMARTLNMTISDDMSFIIRQVETGPKIACKYIEDPVLFTRPDTKKNVKFDLRFIVYVTSLSPVTCYMYNKFWPRFAVNEYSLDNLEDSLAHFTVHNYTDKSLILNMFSDDFIQEFEKTYPNQQWKNVEKQIYEVVKQVITTSSILPSPRGVSPNAQSRGMYGIDVMLGWKDSSHKEIQVYFLECNFIPDCKRACDFYPDFADTTFRTLFLNEIDSEKVTKI